MAYYRRGLGYKTIFIYFLTLYYCCDTIVVDKEDDNMNEMRYQTGRKALHLAELMYIALYDLQLYNHVTKMIDKDKDIEALDLINKILEV